MLGKRGMYLAQAYMMTPAMAAVLVRLFFYQPRFKDAGLRLGRIGDYGRFWIISIGITVISFVSYTLLGGITWDFTGHTFLARLAAQFATAGQDINATLPRGLTPHMMLVIFFVGGLTLFNIVPGLITGFGEEFGHRGFMFPLLYEIRPWAGFIVGGLIWFAWHLPLALVVPQTVHYPLWQMAVRLAVLAIGSICAFTYLAYVYVKTGSVWITSFAHIAMNNSAASFSYFTVIRNQLAADVGLALTMIIAVVVLYFTKQLSVFTSYFARRRDGAMIQTHHETVGLGA
jgi:membrane protease YdiL (CAAX protease family)